ncbi:MAG: branched-chain amino acid ABC transporter permease [Natronomonas sp.]
MSDDSAPDDPGSEATADSTDGASETELSPVETLWNRLEQHNALLVVLTLVGLYVLFTILVWNQNPGDRTNTVVSTLRFVTFLGAAYAILALALNLHWGYTGLFNIGVAGFMAVGVYTMGMAVRAPDASPPGLGLPLPVGIVLGVVMAALIGVVAALPALRLRADYFAIVTLGLSEIIRLSLQSSALNDWLVSTLGVGTGGGSGMGLPQNPIRELFFVDGSVGAGPTALGEAVFAVTDGLDVRPIVVVDWAYVLVLLSFVVLVYAFLDRLGRSPFGRVLKAIREDELVASSLGKDVSLFKIKVFAIGCGLMGLGGILWQGSQGFVAPTPQFLPVITFYIFVAVILGGAGSNTGSIVGGFVFAGLLFEAPRRVGAVAGDATALGDVPTPSNFADAVIPIASGDVTPFLAYSISNIAPLQFVLLGLVIVVLMHRRPDGLLGHRKETASAVDLTDGSRPTIGRTDGGNSDE